MPFWIKQELTYDGLGRTREITLGEKLVKDIYYQKFGDHATNRVSTVWYGVNGIRKDSLKYSYDKAGNIETVTENGKLVARYTYDGLNRLIREDNVKFGTVTYRYDAAGNILSKTHYAFTLKDELGEVVNEYEYSYRQHGWRDQLLSFGETKADIKEECTYDALGNPLSYKGRNLVWQGRRLISYGIENKKATYTYDFNNVRTSKTATDGTTSVTSKYIYDGNNLIAEQRSVKGPDKDKSVWIYYIYGVDGIAGFNYNGVTYLYRKNVQGDITHIYRKDGNKDLVEVAHYAYDAFGNTEILSETDKIGSLNPFRYRGYYFDIETKLYYLISRYYDPETCRFISADSIEYLDPETLGGLNLYAYCLNGPTMNTDPVGTNIASEFSSVADWMFFVLKMGASVIKGLSINLRGTGQIVKGIGSNAKAFGNLMGSATGIISKVSSVFGYALITLSNIIDGVQSGKSALNIATDTIFDCTAIALCGMIGSALGSVIPVLGNFIGGCIGVALGIAYSLISSSQFIKDLKDAFYNGINIVLNGLKSVGNWFKSLFS